MYLGAQDHRPGPPNDAERLVEALAADGSTDPPRAHAPLEPGQPEFWHSPPCPQQHTLDALYTHGQSQAHAPVNVPREPGVVALRARRPPPPAAAVRFFFDEDIAAWAAVSRRRALLPLA